MHLSSKWGQLSEIWFIFDVLAWDIIGLFTPSQLLLVIILVADTAVTGLQRGTYYVPYKVITMLTSVYLDELLTIYTSARPTCRSSTCQILTVPYVLSVFARQSFSFVSPTVWNYLPSDVQSSQSQATFKRRLQRHLFDITSSQFSWTAMLRNDLHASEFMNLAHYKLQLLLLFTGP